MTELVSLRRELRERYRFHGLVGKNPAMQEIYQLIESLAETDTFVTQAPTRYQNFREFLSTLGTATEKVSRKTPFTPDPNLVNALFDSLTDGIFICDPRMQIINFNRAAEEITGYSREEVLGRECVEVCSGKLCGAECAVCQTLLTKRPIRDGRANVHLPELPEFSFLDRIPS